MALSLIEEIQIIRGQYGPKTALLKELVEQSAVGEVDNFYTNVKQVDADVYPLANSYKNKMTTFISKVIENTGMYTDKLTRIIISNLAEIVAITITDVKDATDDQWVGFVDDEMLKAIEILANVLPEEKTEYEASVFPAPTTTTTSTTTETPTTTTTTTV